MVEKSNIWLWLLIVLAISGRCKKDYSDKDIVTDIDGNIYHTVTIGAQVWMSENLRTTRYSDGTNIPAEAFFKDATGKNKTYGNMYMWSAATKGAVSSEANPSGVQGACPTDWHLPSEAEWEELVVYLGGGNIAGGKMKEAGTVHWLQTNAGATNESGFTGLPGGRYYSWLSTLSGYYGFWWSSTGDSTAMAKAISLRNVSEKIFFETMWEETYMSVRCLRDY